MNNLLSKIKVVVQCSLIGALIGFLVGDLVIGVIMWLVTSIKIGRWDSTMSFRTHYGIIFAIIGLFVVPIAFFSFVFIKKKKQSMRIKL
jgi:hypothetical protein